MNSFEKKKAEKRGRMAEYISGILLIMKGYRLLEYRYKTPVGEIDFIVMKKGVIVFVEVKFRCTGYNQEVLTVVMRRRIERAALFYMSSCRVPYDACRFDLVVCKPYRWYHMKQAWIQGE